MTAHTLKKVALITAAAIVVVAVLGYAMLASPAAAQMAASTTTSSTGAPTRTPTSGRMPGFSANHGGLFQWGGPTMGEPFGLQQNQVDVSIGQTITVTSTQGKYFVVGAPSSNGTASGTLTFTVTGKLSEGYTLSVTSGSVIVASVTYTLTSGTAQMNRGASSITGQGATSPAGEFILQASARGSFIGSTGSVHIDLQVGASEYLVSLAGSISG